MKASLLTFLGSLSAVLAACAAETALVRVKWSEFVTTDKVDRVMANAYVTAKPLGDAQAIPLHDAGKTIVYDWETGDADDLLAAIGVGAEYVRTSRPLEARAIIGAQAAKAGRGALLRDRNSFRIRDPFILADDATKTYYLYETTDPYKGRPYARGVSVRMSKDLAAWSQPRPVMSVPPKDRCRTVWAPEVYKVRNRYLMFATLSFYPDREGARGSRAQDKTCRRGTWIYEASSPAGPFKPVSGKPATPEDMMALDGTFFMDGDRPYMVFCHEWVQTMTGGVCVAALKADFTGLAETPRSLFDATAAAPKSRVTDGPCLHRMKDGRLFMIWSTSRIREGYCVMQTESASGTVYGPWKEHKVIYGKNGGHGSLFRTFEGALKLVLHGPNRRGLEHLRILDVAETADGLVVTEPPPKAVAPTFPPYDCASFIDGVSFRASGAFRTERDADGRWWLVDPLGRGFLSFGVQSANWQGCYDPAHDRYAYRETNIKQFGTPEKWAEDTIRKYTDWGFNTLSFGCGSELDGRGVPRIRVALFGQRMCHLGMPEEYWINAEHSPAGSAFPNVFHPRFAEICSLVAKWMCAPYKDDPWTIGYYLDNELAWGRGKTAPGVPKPFALFEVCMRKKPGHSARVAAEEWVRAHGADPAGKVPDEVKRGFLLEIARRYFKTTSEAVRAADPNHLVMGCRFAGLNGAGDDEVWNIAGEYCDVVSFNCYPMTDIDRNTVSPNATDGRSCREVFDALYARTKKPMIIPEWAFPALDSGLPCLHGAGQRFYTQAERTQATELWMRTLLPMPYIVGWAVFRWVDQPRGGAGGNGEDSNYGLVNEAGVPYPCVEMFARIQKNAKALRYAPPPETREAPPISTRVVDEMLARMPKMAGGRVDFVREGDSFRVTNGGLLAEGRIGGETLLANVALDGRTLGKWDFMIHHDRDSVRRWTHASRVTAADWEPSADGGGRLVVTAEGLDSDIAFRVKEGFTFTPGHPAFRAEVLAFENIGRKPITMRRFYFCPVAPFAGEVPAKEAQPVPNLWRAPKASAWIAKDGRFWGVITDAERMGAMNFHVEPNGGVHPDFAIVPLLRQKMRDETLAPGASYVPAPEERMRAWAMPGLGGAGEWRRIVRPRP